MIRSLIVLTVTACFAKMCVAQTEETRVSLADVKMDLAQLAKTAHVEYGLFTGTKSWDPKKGEEQATVRYASSGILSLDTQVTADQVNLHDVLRKGEKSRFDARLTCRKDNYLNPASVVIDLGRGRIVNYTVSKGEVTATMGEKTMKMPFPKDILSQSALYRILPLLPRTKGVTVDVPAFTEVPEFRPPRKEQPYTITCLGKESLDVAGNPVEATKFEIRGGRKMDAWVSVDGRLLRIHDLAGIRMELLPAK